MKKSILLLTIVILASLSLPTDAKTHQSEEIITPMTQLEKRQFQTRVYTLEDQNLVLKSILNVLQDEGYIVNNVNSLLGFVYGVKDFDVSDKNIDISKEFGFTKSRLSYNGVKVATLETCVNVTKYGENLRIRVNFKRKLLNEYGNAQFIEDISDAEFYANFYEKLDRAISLHTQINNSKLNENNINIQTSALNENDGETNIDSTESTSIENIIPLDLEKEIHQQVEKIIDYKSDDIPTLILQDSAPEQIKSDNEDETSDNINEINSSTENSAQDISESEENIKVNIKENELEDSNTEKSQQLEENEQTTADIFDNINSEELSNSEEELNIEPQKNLKKSKKTVKKLSGTNDITENQEQEKIKKQPASIKEQTDYPTVQINYESSSDEVLLELDGVNE